MRVSPAVDGEKEKVFLKLNVVSADAKRQEFHLPLVILTWAV
jgi:hypothetical protein